MEIVKLSHVEVDPMFEDTAMLVFEYDKMYTTCWTSDNGTIGCGFDDPNDLLVLQSIGSVVTRFQVRLATVEDYRRYKKQVDYVQQKLNENLDAIKRKILRIRRMIE